MKSVTITANRKLSENDKVTIFNKMSLLITDRNIKTIYFGGAVGGDTVALEACMTILSLGKPQLIVVVPCKLINQPKITQEISSKADKLIELNNVITSNDGWAAFHKRNEYMVDHSDEVVSFWAGDKKSGTYSCMRYAELQNKKVDVIDIEGLDI